MFSRWVGAAVPLASLLAMVATAICAAEVSVIAKQFPRSHPVTTNAVAMATGAVILLALSAVFRESRTVLAQAATWVALSYLVLLGSSTAFVLFPFVLKQWPASAGGLLVLAGVYLGAIVRTPFARTPHRPGSEPCLTCAE